MRASTIKNLEANLTFLTKSRENLNQSLTVLFDGWDAYGEQKFDDAASKASQSEVLARKAVRNCLVGIAREYIRRAQSRISAGRKIFAKVKDARKKLDDAIADFSRYEKKLADNWTTETEDTLQLVIKIAKEAGIDAQYSIDDAKLPFLVTLVTAVLHYRRCLDVVRDYQVPGSSLMLVEQMFTITNGELVNAENLACDAAI